MQEWGKKDPLGTLKENKLNESEIGRLDHIMS